MTEPASKICPFCSSVQLAEVLVCTVCNRDIAVPVALQAEYDDLLLKRTVLKDRIATAKARIAAIRSKGRAAP